MLRLMGLSKVARYPEATVTREDRHLIIYFGGRDHEQTVSVPLKYVLDPHGDLQGAQRA